MMRILDELERAWCSDTAAQGEWDEDCPSMNQCVVTALVVQDYFGGELLCCEMTDGNSHYWNRLLDGTEVDLTEEQFEWIIEKPLRETVIVCDREDVLSIPDTRWRYELLRSKLGLERG